MRKFASLLGWNGLELFVVGPIDGVGFVSFYQTPDEKFNLQINEIPSGQCSTHQATVKASRYGISSIGWVPFTLFDDPLKLKEEAMRIRPGLDRKNWKSKIWRRQQRFEDGVTLPCSKKKLRGYTR